MSSDGASLTIRVTDVGEFVRHHSCQRRFALGFDHQRLFRQLPFTEQLHRTIDPVLAEQGKLREQEWALSLEDRGIEPLALPERIPGRGAPFVELAQQLAGLHAGQERFAREVQVGGELGSFSLHGRIDFAILRWDPDAHKPLLWLVECKASRRDHTYQRIQVVLYQMLVEQWMAQQPLWVGEHRLGPEDLRVAVVRMDEATHQMMALEALRPLERTHQLAVDIGLLLRQGGPLTQALQAPLEELPYQLEGKCDGCLFHVHCMAESARLRRLELLGLAPEVIRSLQRAGVTDLESLADMPLDGAAANALRADPECNQDVEALKLRAQARRLHLPGAQRPPDTYEVRPLPHRGQGHLPPHQQPQGARLLRVYLNVHYDYAENRVGALAAHITDSDGELYAVWGRQGEGEPQASPEVKETWRHQGRRSLRSLRGVSVVEIKQGEWTGRYDADSAAEQSLLRAFLGKVVRQLQLQAPAPEVPIHFYVWSQREIQLLLESCERAGGGLLRYMRELLGCRQSLEQLIYSSLEHEVQSRYTTAWTGRGLSVATSLPWFGRRFHWRRRVGQQVHDLDQVLARDLFDFQAPLHLDPQGQWCSPEDPEARAVNVEIRPRFYDNLSAPYWRAYWGTLPQADDPEVDPQAREALLAYQRAAAPGVLEAYLEARVHALRWLEERMLPKNPDLRKPPMELSSLPSFRLETDSPAAAAVDYLRLDQHIKFAQWLRDHLMPPSLRVAAGESVPVRELRRLDDRGRRLRGQLDPVPYLMDREQLMRRCSLRPGKMVRLTPVRQGPHHGQSVEDLLDQGRTCMVDAVHWDQGTVDLSVIPSGQGNYYTLNSQDFSRGEPFGCATLDASITNFVDAKVEKRLAPTQGRLRGAHMEAWFDPVRPSIPPQQPLEEPTAQALRHLLEHLALPTGQGRAAPLLPERVEIILRGLNSRIQLIQGPPGTGKTMVTALAVLTRILARRQPGDLVLITAHTHTAVDTLLRRIDAVTELVAQAAGSLPGLHWPGVRLGKIFSSRDQAEASDLGGRVRAYPAQGSYRDIQAQGKEGVVILGATTSAMLKWVAHLNKDIKAYKEEPEGFQAPFLVVDEASMMVFAHFFALATLVSPQGELLLAGDHRQLAPIAAHDWDREDRPPAQFFRMHASAFDAVSRLRHPDEQDRLVRKRRVQDSQVRRDGLETTFRLPPAIRRLIQPLYDMDALVLRGPRHQRPPSLRRVAPSLGSIWGSGHSLYLVVHQEGQSRQSNPFEAHLVRHILDAGLDAEAVEPHSVVVMTPHRAQRALLQGMLAEYEDLVRMVDTVERMQGGESQTVIYSATVSDPVAIAQETAFLMNLERTNVAFSRPKRRLVVICGQALLDFVPPRLEDYQTALLWKQLRALCDTPLAGGELGVTPYQVRVWGSEGED